MNKDHEQEISSQMPVAGGDNYGNRSSDTARRPQLSVVVPCFNEQDVIGETYHRLSDACRVSVNDDYEIIFVNDGSSDGTWSIMRDLAGRDPAVVAVDLSRNHGHQLALSAGLSVCRGERILMIDADLQDPPELLGEMMRLMDEGADVVYGQRVERKGETVFKKIAASAFYHFLIRIVDIRIPRDAGDFRLINRRVLDALLAMPEQHRFVRGMVAWLGFRQVPLPYVRGPRFAGTTKYPLRKMVRFAVDAITGFSMMPLRLSVYLAIAFLVVAVLMAGYIIYSWLFLDVVGGWTSMILALVIFSSVQLFCIGIIGEYVGRIFLQTKNRPLFIINEIVTKDNGVRRREEELEHVAKGS